MLVFHGTYIQLNATWWFPNIDFNPEEGGGGYHIAFFKLEKEATRGTAPLHR